ncbi:hypothetical protein GCM10027596_22160 [Nocardioides korecus]
MTKPQVKSDAQVVAGRGLLHRGRRLLGEGAHLTANHVLFAGAAVLITSALVRQSSSNLAAAVLAGYAVESVVVTAARGYFVTAPVYRHQPLTELCRDDLGFAAWRMVTVTVLAWPVFTAVTYWLYPHVTVAVVAGFWASSMMIGDLGRTLNATFATGRSALVSMAAYTAATAALGLLAHHVGVVLLLSLSGALSLLLAGTSLALLATRSRPGACRFWQREARFARALAGEGAGAVVSLALAQLVIARLAPQEMVALQVANQAVASPALLLVNGLSVPIIRRAQRRRAAGRSEVSILAAWAGADAVLLAAACLAAFAVTPILEHVFGDPWAKALDLVLPLAAYVAVVAAVQAFLTRYRSYIDPRRIRRAFVLMLALGQLPQVAWVGLEWPGGLSMGLLIGAAVVGVSAAAQLYRWERSVLPRAHQRTP